MRIRKLLLIVMMPLLLAATASLALADPPPWAPAHGYRAKHEHRYVYYPNGEVYYAPARHMWFWLSGNGWQAGVNLPLALRAYVRVGGVNISLNAARPYERHAYVERHYGGHRVHWRRHDRDEHGHRHGRRHGHGRGHGHRGRHHDDDD